MAASVYGGAAIKFGITSEETKGFYAASLTCSMTNEQAWVKNHQGEDVGVSLFNEAAEISLQGVVTTANTAGQSLAGVLSINSTAIYGTDSGVTVFYVTSATLSESQADFQSGDVTAVGRVGLTDTVAA